MKRQQFVILTPKNDAAKLRLEYHSERWLLKGTQDGLKYSHDQARYYRVVSRDGSKLMLVKETDDKDFYVRLL